MLFHIITLFSSYTIYYNEYISRKVLWVRRKKTFRWSFQPSFRPMSQSTSFFEICEIRIELIFFCSIFRSCFCHIISIYISFIKHSNITTNIFKNIEDITLVVYIGKNFTMKMILNHYDSSFGVCDITISWNMCMHINPVLRLATKEPHCSLTKFSRM